MAAGCAVRPSRRSKLRRAGNHPGCARPIENALAKIRHPSVRGKKWAQILKSFKSRLPPVALAGRTEPHPEKSPLRGKTSVSSFESRTLTATRFAKICFPSARVGLAAEISLWISTDCTGTQSAKLAFQRLAQKHWRQRLWTTKWRRHRRCCLLQPQVNKGVVFFFKAFVVAPPRSKRARVQVERTFRPRRPARSLRRRVHVGVRPFVRFSRAAKDREEARFHCWRFFVTGVFGTPAAFAFALRRRGARGV